MGKANGIKTGDGKMLKLKLIEYPKNNNHYYDLVDEFNEQSWNGRTFQSIGEAIDYCENHLEINVDIFGMSRFEYIVETR